MHIAQYVKFQILRNCSDFSHAVRVTIVTSSVLLLNFAIFISVQFLVFCKSCFICYHLAAI